MTSWLQTPPGDCVRQWEHERLDQAVDDAFGFHAVQLGLPALQSLRANRMPNRWVLGEMPRGSGSGGGNPGLAGLALPPLVRDGTPADGVALRCDFDALPFPAHSIDLAVLPHTLELARDPHQTLREVERVLVPEGRLVITGFNPASAWGVRQRFGQLRQGLIAGRDTPTYLPADVEFIGYWRLRDWLRLLGFELELGRFGVYRPPWRTQRWIDRWAWIEPAGDRWWPVFGAVYLMVAVKRVRGMRLVGRLARPARAPAASVATVNRGGAASRSRPDPTTTAAATVRTEDPR